jgi:hypothetical protein
VLTWRVSALGVAAASAATLAAFLRLRRTWPDAAAPAAVVIALAVAAALAGLPLSPAGAEAVAALAALRAEPFLLPDPARRDTLFHLLAWGPALALGDEGAVRAVAGAAAGSAVLLAHALARSAGLGLLGGVSAQAALVLLALAAGHTLYTETLPAAFVLLLLVHLARRLPRLEGARDTAAAFAYLTLAQACSAVTTLEVALLVAVLACAEALAGERRRALRLFTSEAASLAAVLALRYLPVWLGWAITASPAPPGPTPFVPLALAAVTGGVGLAVLPRATAAPRVLASAVAAGLATLVLAGPDPRASPTPALALLAPAAACGVAALVARLSGRTTAAPAPGNRS